MAGCSSDCHSIGKSQIVVPKELKKHLPQLEGMRLSDAASHVSLSKELDFKLRFMLGKYSSCAEEEFRLVKKVMEFFERDILRTNMRQFIGLKRHMAQTKKVWALRGLPVDRESLQSAAASTDAFDMSSLRKSLPSKPCPDDGKIAYKAEIIAKYLKSCIIRRNAFSRLEISRPLASNTPELKSNLPSCSSEVGQPVPLVNLVKKVCGDVKNTRIFSFRPCIRAQRGPFGSSSSSMNGERFGVPGFQGSTIRCKGNTNGGMNGWNRVEEAFVFSNSQGAQTHETGIAKEKENSEDGQNSNIENKLQNPEPQSLFIGSHDDRHSNMNLYVQQLYNGVSLSRQMSRLKLSNSRRGGISENVDESEITEASSEPEPKGVGI